MTDQPVTTPARIKEAIYDNHLVRVVGEPNAAGRIKIQWDEGAGRVKEIWVHETELTYMDEKLPPTIMALAARLNPGFEASHRVFGQQYVSLLRRIRRENEIGDWFRVYSELHAPHAHRLRTDCAQLARNGFLEHKPANGGIDYWVSKMGCEALGIEYRPSSAAAEAPAAIAPTPAQEKAAVRQPVEVRTLIQFLDKSKERGDADRELAEHLNGGWRLMDITILAGPIRVVTLQRWPEPEPTPQPQARASAEAPAAVEEPVQAQRIVEPVGPEVIFTPSYMSINLGPYGRSIVTSGLDETLAIADQKAADAGRTAYEQALEATAIPVRPLIPSEVKS